MASEILTCRALVETITEYLDGALSPAEYAAFEAHLRICPGCRNYLGQIRETIQAVGTLRASELSDAEQAQLLTLFRDWKRTVPDASSS